VKERAEPCALLHESVRLQSTSLGVLQLDLRRDPVIPIGLGFVAAGDAQSPEEDLVASIRQDVGLLFLLCNNGGIPCLSVRAVRTTNMYLQHQAFVGGRLDEYNPCHTYLLRGRNGLSPSGIKPIKRAPLKDLSKSWLAVALDKTAFPGRMSIRRKGVPKRVRKRRTVALCCFKSHTKVVFKAGWGLSVTLLDFVPFVADVFFFL